MKESGLFGMSESMLQNMWTKAEGLVASDGHIVKVPWSGDAKERLVYCL